MLSDDLFTASEAMRLSSDAPAGDLRAALVAYSDATFRAGNRAAELERIVVRQRKVIAWKAFARRLWHGVTALVVEGAR